jgi:hypothetical protein
LIWAIALGVVAAWRYVAPVLFRSGLRDATVLADHRLRVVELRGLGGDPDLEAVGLVLCSVAAFAIIFAVCYPSVREGRLLRWTFWASHCASGVLVGSLVLKWVGDVTHQSTYMIVAALIVLLLALASVAYPFRWIAPRLLGGALLRTATTRVPHARPALSDVVTLLVVLFIVVPQILGAGVATVAHRAQPESRRAKYHLVMTNERSPLNGAVVQVLYRDPDVVVLAPVREHGLDASLLASAPGVLQSAAYVVRRDQIESLGQLLEPAPATQPATQGRNGAAER